MNSFLKLTGAVLACGLFSVVGMQSVAGDTGVSGPEFTTARVLEGETIPNRTTLLAAAQPCGDLSITQSLDTVTITELNSVSCNAGGLHTDNAYVRAFESGNFLPAGDLPNPFTVCSVEFGIEQALAGNGVSQPLEVRLYDTADVNNLNAGTLIGSVAVEVPDQALTIFNVDVEGTTLTGELTVEIFTPEGQTDGNSFFVGSNPNGQTAPTYLAAADCGVPTPLPTGDLGFPDMHMVMIVNGEGEPAEPTGACCQCDDDVQFCTIQTEAECADFGGEYLGDDTVCEAGGGEQVIRESLPNAPIPDCDAGGLIDIIDMGMSFEIQDLEVDLITDHTWIGDLCVTLQKDAGPPITLIQRMNLDAPCDVTGCCGCSSDGMDILLDDEGDGPIEDQCGGGGGLLTGTWIPEESLSTYVGEDSAGTWTIFINDNACADTGSLVQWSLHFTQPGGGVTPCEEAFPDQCVEEVGAFLDIKPGSCPNPLNVKSRGYLPVALVGTDTFDVLDVDIASLSLRRADGVGGSAAPNEGPPGPHSTVDDVATPFEGELCDCHEMEGDGIDDLMMHFSRTLVVDQLELDDLGPNDEVVLELTGTLLDGTEFVAADCILLKPSSSNGWME